MYFWRRFCHADPLFSGDPVSESDASCSGNVESNGSSSIDGILPIPSRIFFLDVLKSASAGSPIQLLNDSPGRISAAMAVRGDNLSTGKGFDPGSNDSFGRAG